MPRNRSARRWLYLVGGAAVLAALVWRLGVGPFIDGIAMVDGHALVATAVITFFTTVCCAWRWRLVARGLGVDIPLRAAVAAYYRSQFLNSVLPGGVLGDVHRGVAHGLNSGDVGRSLRAVAWERVGGQIVQVAFALTLLALAPSPVRSYVPVLVVLALAVVAVGFVILFRTRAGRGTSFWARAGRVAAADFRGLLGRDVWPGVVVLSCTVTAGYAAVFLIAAETAGSTVPPVRMLPLALLVLLAMSIPTNIAGWGPREGAAAWVFSAAGLGASQGVTVAVVYGVLTFAACLPGAAVLVVERHRHRTRSVHLADSARSLQPAVEYEGTGARG